MPKVAEPLRDWVITNLNHESGWSYLLGVLLLVGAFKTSLFLWRTFAVITQTFLIPGTSLTKFTNGNSWAVVTGASDGIGKEFALKLGKAGFNVVLVARNQGLLHQVASEIEERYSVSTKIHVIDFTQTDENSYTSFSNELHGLDIGILVNNVGKGHSIPACFIDVGTKEYEDIVAVNITANLRVTKVVLPMMIQRNEADPRSRGLIINVGSFSGAVPVPMLQPYSATKAFMATFSTALAEELKPHRIMVEHLNAYFIVSKLSKIPRPSFFIPTADAYVDSVLSKIGLACGAANTGRPNTSSPYWTHAFIDWLVNSTPGNPGIFVKTGFKMQQKTRELKLKRLADKAKHR